MARRAAGFSYLEATIALAIVLVAMSIAMIFFVNLGGTMHTESTTLATQQTGRLVLDELARSSRQAGFGISRTDPYNPGAWQASIVHASSHTLAFNADIDRSVGSLGSSVTLSFPVGPDYKGEGSGTSRTGAETYVYTIDADGDGALTAADRTDAAAGSFNPAAETDNPFDFAIFRRIYGFNGTDQGGALEPLAPYLFTDATDDAVYPDGTTPDPLFTYWLTEDLNADGLLSDAECVNDVVDTCPPTGPREPRLYLWGDDDFDGVLSESEKAALRTMEVGSTAWSGNRLLDAGAYPSTALAAAIDPSDTDPYTLTVTDASKFLPGELVLLGSGGTAERHAIDSVVTGSSEEILLSTPVANAQSAGATLTVQAATLLRAIRSIGITYSAMTGERDVNGRTRAIGRAGRVGTRGLDYQVRPFHREVEVINAPSVALVKTTPPGAVDVCPLEIVNDCSGQDIEESTRYTNLAGQNQFVFRVEDEGGSPVEGVEVELSNAYSGLGSLAADKLTTNASGKVTATYNMSGSLGRDEIKAEVTCVTDAGLIDTNDAVAHVDLFRLDTELSTACVGTVGPKEPQPQSPVRVTVVSSDGPVSGVNVELSLAFDPLFLSSPPDFSALVGGLRVGGSIVGTTDSAGVMAPFTIATDTNGEVNAGAGLVSDDAGKGARLLVTTGIPADGCATAPESREDAAMFFALALDSVTPSPGCTTSTPCTISAGEPVPRVLARLSINDNPVPGAPLTFVTTDVETPTDGLETGASVVKPSSGVTTDASGEGRAAISNNGASVITPATPLVTQVDVTSTGNPGLCSSGLIRSNDPTLEFRFEAPAPQCKAELDQAWLSKIDDKKVCVHSRNANDDGGCDQYLKGVRITVYQADGVTPVPGVQINKLEGGAVTAAPSCSTTGMVRLFEPKCHAENRKLDNGELWLFTAYQTCLPPLAPVTPQDYFTFSKIEFGSNYPDGAPMDIELVFACDGECEPDLIESEVYRVQLPF